MQNVLTEHLVKPVYVHKRKNVQVDQSEVERLSELGKPTSDTSLTETQIASNHLLQFLNEVCRMDDEITCKQIIFNDKLNFSLNIFHAKLRQNELDLRVKSNVHHGISEYFNVYSLQQTPTEVFLKKFSLIYKLVYRDMIETIQDSDWNRLKHQFTNVV